MQRFLIFSVTLAITLPSFVFAQIATSTNSWAIMAQYASGTATNAPVIERDTVFTLSKSILALVAAGGDPRAGTYGDLVREFSDSYVRERQIGNPAYVNDDFWGILALRAGGVPTDHTVIRGARAFVEKAQRPNGGWSWSPTYPMADTDDTAAAIMALLESGVSSSDPMIQRALGYLHGAQNADGGFPSVPPAVSSIESTAWVVSALSRAGENPSTWTKSGKDPLAYLRSQEKSDGSFGGVQATAFATIALAGKSYPVRSYVAPVIVPPQQQEQPREVVTSQAIPPPVIQQQPAALEPVVKKNVPTKKKIMKKAKKSRKVMKVKKKVKKERIKPR